VLGFELPCFAGDPTWRLPDRELGRWMASFGPELGFHRRELLESFVVRVPEAYPLYETGHQRRAGRVLRWLHGELRNLFVVGRNGLFRLDNMDHAFSMGFDLARHLRRDGTPLAWHRGLERYSGLSYID
jgi:UDP-galactopyranose mutase